MSFSYLCELFLWFMVYSIAGWIYESILCSITEKKLVNRGFLNGPYCPIYGAGAIVDIVVLGKLTNPLILFISGFVLAGILEYFTSWLMEKLFHARWWDYSKMFMNINGRVCLLGLTVFGVFAVVLVDFIQPFVEYVFSLIPMGVINTLTGILFVCFVTDIIITVVGFIHFEDKLKALAESLANATSPILEKAQGMLANGTDSIVNKVVGIKDGIMDRLEDNGVYKTITGAYNEFINKVNGQEQRMLKAFPKFKSLKYDEELKAVKKYAKENR